MEDSKLGVKPIMYSFTWLDSHSKFNNMQQYEDWEVGNSVSVLTLSHSGQSIHALHDKWGGKGEEKKPEYSGLWNRFNLFCQNRLQSVASLLECCEAPISLCFSLFPIIAIWHSPFLCRPGSVTLTQAFFWLCRLLPTSLVKTYDHPSWIKHYNPPCVSTGYCSGWKWEHKRRRYAHKIGHLLSKWNT